MGRDEKEDKAGKGKKRENAQMGKEASFTPLPSFTIDDDDNVERRQAPDGASPFEISPSTPTTPAPQNLYEAAQRYGLLFSFGLATGLIGIVIGFTARLTSGDVPPLPSGGVVSAPLPSTVPTYTSSPSGLSMLSQMDPATALAHAYHTPVQVNQANCGLASSAGVLNSLRASLDGEQIGEAPEEKVRFWGWGDRGWGAGLDSAVWFVVWFIVFSSHPFSTHPVRHISRTGTTHRLA